MRHSSISRATVVPSRLKKSSSNADTSSAAIAATGSALAIRHQLIPTQPDEANPKPLLSEKLRSHLDSCTVVLRTLCNNYALTAAQRVLNAEVHVHLTRTSSKHLDLERLLCRSEGQRGSRSRRCRVTLPRGGDNSLVTSGFLWKVRQFIARHYAQNTFFSHKNAPDIPRCVGRRALNSRGEVLSRLDLRMTLIVNWGSALRAIFGARPARSHSWQQFCNG